jgi:TolA-binding protein
MFIFDAEVLGDSVGSADEAFVTAHEATCAACARERSVWLAMRAAPEENLGANVALVDAALRVARRSPVRWLPRPTTALALAAAAVILALLGTRWRHVPAAIPDTRVAVRIVGVTGDVAIDGEPAREGGAIAEGARITSHGGRACVVVAPSVRVCLDAFAEAQLADLTLAHRRVEVAHGHVVASLDPQPAGSTFTLSTSAGTVTAVGTAFSVDVADDVVVARVSHGVVIVRSGASELRLSAHERVELAASSTIAAMTGEDERRDEALLALRVLDPPSSPPSASAEVHAPTPIPSSTVVSSSRPPVALPTPSAPEMLRAARQLRADGRYAEAAQAYQRLQAAYPSSGEARASLLSLGDLQLGSLGDATGALRSFDAYLQGGGALAEEASYGRIRALRALGRKDDERASIDAFLLAYPSSVETQALVARRNDIGSKK